MNINKDIHEFLVDTVSVRPTKESIRYGESIPSNKVGKTFETTKYEGFNLVNEYAVSNDKKIILSSNIVTNQNEIIMKSLNEIEVVALKNSRYLINSSEQTIIAEIEDGEIQVLNSANRLVPDEMYKITDYLNSHGVVILTDYNEAEKRNFEYLYNYITGKRISSGFDSIDEVNGKLKVTYGLATGNLDLEGNFIMEPDDEYIPPKNIFARLFNKGRC